MISPVRPSPSYNVQNESEFRRQVQESDKQNLKANVGFGSFIMIDESDGSAQRVSMVAGVLTVTAL